MAFRVLLLCVSALLAQSISGSCTDDAVVITEDCNCGDSNSGSGTITSITTGNSGSNHANNIGSSSNCGSSSNYRSYSIINNPKSKAGTNSISGSSSTRGGPFIVTSTGPVIPNGLNINSNNNLAGDLTVVGQLPFLSAVGFEGSFPSNGLASVSYGCGDGNISIQEVIGGSLGSSSSPISSGASLPSGTVGYPGASFSSGSPGTSGSYGNSGSFGSSSGCKYY